MLFVYHCDVAEQKPIPVRLSDDLISRLDKAAGKIGSNRAALIRLCTQTFLDHLDDNGFGALPIDWQTIIAETDGRRNFRLNEPEPGKEISVAVPPPVRKVNYRDKLPKASKQKKPSKPD